MCRQFALNVLLPGCCQRGRVEHQVFSRLLAFRFVIGGTAVGQCAPAIAQLLDNIPAIVVRNSGPGGDFSQRAIAAFADAGLLVHLAHADARRDNFWQIGWPARFTAAAWLGGFFRGHRLCAGLDGGQTVAINAARYGGRIGKCRCSFSAIQE